MMQMFKCSDRVFYSVIFAVFALPMILFYTFAVPPFQVPDEPSHFARAYQLTHGEFFPTKQSRRFLAESHTVGGTVDPGIFEVSDYFKYLRQRVKPRRTLSPETEVQAAAVTWQGGEFRSTRNVSIYPPTYYVVPALGILAGQAFDMNIVDTLLLARVMNGLVAMSLICLAIYLLRRGHGVFCVMLLMPMTLAQLASASQDTMCLAASALCVALMSQIGPDLPAFKRRTFLALAGMFLISMAGARPPYAALSLFFLYFAFIFRSHRQVALECCVAFVATMLVTLLWSLYVVLFVSVKFGPPGVDYAQQALFVLSSPLQWLAILLETLSQRWPYYVGAFIGIVGHLDTPFPGNYYSATVLTLAFAFLASYWADRGRAPRALLEQALWPGLIVLAAIVGVFAVLYMSWNPVRSPVINGVQGRYFIPVALFLALGASKNTLSGVSQTVYRSIIIAFALATSIVSPLVVIARFY